MLVQASSLSLIPSPSLSSPRPLSLLFDPTSQSLAVTLSDASILLFSFFPPPPLPPPTSVPLSIPPISTSACFLLLTPNPNSSCPLFVTASPSPSSSSTVIRAWIRRSKSDLFSPLALRFKKQIGGRNGVILDLSHGFGVQIAGSVNVMVVHSSAERQIWVLGVRMEGDEMVELVKCAVIGCTVPIYEIRVATGVLILGEVGGVRIFPLRLMIKGGQVVKKKRRDQNAGEVVQEPDIRGQLANFDFALFEITS